MEDWGNWTRMPVTEAFGQSPTFGRVSECLHVNEASVESIQ